MTNTNSNLINKLNHISQHHQINIPAASNALPPVKLPCIDLVGVRDDYNSICVPLYKASITGDWKSAKLILDKRPELVRYSITENYETPLHIAVSVKCTTQGKQFVEEMMSMIKMGDLELQNGNGETCLNIAVVAGNVAMAKIIVNKNEALLTIPTCEGKMPLCTAALFGNHEMVEYLYDTCGKMTSHYWTYENRSYVLLKCLEADLFDIALRIVQDNPELATNGDALRILARKPRVFEKYLYATNMWGSTYSYLFEFWVWDTIISCFGAVNTLTEDGPALKLLRIIWGSILQLNKDEISAIMRGPPDLLLKPTTAFPDQKLKYSSQMLFVAAECGNKTFVVELVTRYPDLIRQVNDNNQSIFHVAVAHRHTGIYNLMDEIGSIKDSVISLEDENGNNMLHLAGERPKSDILKNVPGVVFQMQQELIWFKEVEALLPRYYREKRNKNGLTPREVFSKNHEDLLTKGEKWLKEVATQLMVVSTIIVSIAFAVPFTVPGGFHQDSGTPIFLNKLVFSVLMIFDALSLMFASHASLLVIYILSSSYTERDFLSTLPTTLFGCLGSLFVASVAMMLTYVLSFFIYYSNKSQGIPVLVAIFAFALYLVSFYLASELYPLFMYAKTRASVHNQTGNSRHVIRQQIHGPRDGVKHRQLYLYIGPWVIRLVI